MKNIILNLAITLDGFIEGPNGEIDWCIMDEEMGFHAFLDSIDTIFYGRISYDNWGNYQPDEHMSLPDKKLWEAIHQKNKYVFSSKERIDPHAKFISTDLAAKVAAIKQQPGKDIWLYGGANLTKTFLQLGLIDIYKLSVHPIILGSGKPLFEDIKEPIGLHLMATKTYKSGVVELTYHTGGPV